DGRPRIMLLEAEGALTAAEGQTDEALRKLDFAASTAESLGLNLDAERIQSIVAEFGQEEAKMVRIRKADQPAGEAAGQEPASEVWTNILMGRPFVRSQDNNSGNMQ